MNQFEKALKDKPSILERILRMEARVSRGIPIRKPVVLLGLKEAAQLIAEMEERALKQFDSLETALSNVDPNYRIYAAQEKFERMRQGEYVVQTYQGQVQIKVLEDRESFMGYEVEDPNWDRHPPKHISEKDLYDYVYRKKYGVGDEF